MQNIINFSDTTPAAPTGTLNVKWQNDASVPPNVSGNVPLGGLFTRTVYTGLSPALRAYNTNYQNTAATPLWVMGTFANSSGNNPLFAYCDATATPSTVVVEQTPNTASQVFLFIVPPSYYYKINGASASTTDLTWAEYQQNSGSVVQAAPARSLSVAYQNTSGFAKLVVAVLSGVGNNTVVQGISDASASPTTVVWNATGLAASSFYTVYMMIPNNHYYEVVCSGAAVAYWNEYTLSFNATKSLNLVAAASLQRGMCLGGNNLSTGQPFPIYFNSQLYDVFVSVSLTQSTWYSFLTAAGPAAIPMDRSTYVGTPGCIGMNVAGNNGNPVAGFLLAQPGDFYCVGTNGSFSDTQNHWWEYLLG